MRAKFVLGAFFVFFLLLVIPSIPAVESHIVKDTNERQLQQIAEGHFFDIALFLTIVNTIIMRAISGFQFTAKGMFYSVYIMIYTLSLVQLLKQEYSSGQKSVRYKAYQVYFASLFSIFSVGLAKKLANAPPRITATIMVIVFFASLFLAKYLGNVIYVALGRPS